MTDERKLGDLIVNTRTIGRDARFYLESSPPYDFDPVCRYEAGKRDTGEFVAEIREAMNHRQAAAHIARIARRMNWYLPRRIGGRWWEISNRELRRQMRQLSHRRSH